MPEPLTTLGRCSKCGAVDLYASFPSCHGSRSATNHVLEPTDRVPVFSEGDMQAVQERADRFEMEANMANEHAAVVAEALRETLDRASNYIKAVAAGAGQEAAERLTEAMDLGMTALPGSPRSHELVPLGTQEALVALVDAEEANEAGMTPDQTRAWSQHLRVCVRQGRALVEGVERTHTPGPDTDLCERIAAKIGTLAWIRPDVAEPEQVNVAELVGYVLHWARQMGAACPRCEGHGTVGVAQRDEDPTECPECGGAGWVVQGSLYDGSAEQLPCPECERRHRRAHPPSGITDPEAELDMPLMRRDDPDTADVIDRLVDERDAQLPSEGHTLVPSISGDTTICGDCLAIATERCVVEGHGFADLDELYKAYSSPHIPPKGHTLVPNEVLERVADGLALSVGSEYRSRSWIAALREAARGGCPQWPGTGDGR